MEKIRLLVLADLAVDSRHARKIKREFEHFLFADGFCSLQEGVYTRLADGRSNAELHKRRLQSNKPETGIVRLLILTERQFQASLIISGVECPQEVEIGAQLDIFL